MQTEDLRQVIASTTHLAGEGVMDYTEIQIALMIRGTVFSFGYGRIKDVPVGQLPELYTRLVNLRNSIQQSLLERNK